MKATGIVRRIDDLGRVVIPKEIRRTMRIREGDPLEIYTDKEGSVIFRKYSLMSGLGEFSAQLCDTLYKTTGRTVVITDRDSCISAAGNARRELSERTVSPKLEQLMQKRQIYQAESGAPSVQVCADVPGYVAETAAPIVSEGDVLGSVVFVAPQGAAQADQVQYKLAQTIAGFLGKHMES